MEPFPLSSVDTLFLGPGSQPITFALSYSSFLDHTRLTAGLEQALGAFPLIAARLVNGPGGEQQLLVSEHSIEIQQRNRPQTFDPAGGIQPFIEPVRSAEGEPLARFTLTRTPTGSVLAASISHAVVDGFSYFHFLSSWSRICRGERILAPSLDRTFVGDIRAAAKEGSREVDLTGSCGLFKGGRRTDPEPTRVQPQGFTISGDELAKQAEDARRTAGTQLTENDVLVAILWKRMLSGAEAGTTYVTCPVDYRRLLPGFPRTYLGCALVFATASYPATDLGKAPVGQLAILIRDAVARMKGDSILSSLRALEVYRRTWGPGGMEQVHLRHPERGIIVTNLTRMPIADVDFGSGPPETFVPFVGIQRGAAILPAKSGVFVISSV